MRSSFPMMERISASYEIGCFRHMTGRRRVHTEGFSLSPYSAVFFVDFTAGNGHCLKSLCIGVAVLTILADAVQLYYSPFSHRDRICDALF